MWNGLSSCFSMLLVISVGVAASTDPVGMLYPSESVYLNGIEVDHSNPVTPGDVIRTKERGTATVQIVRNCLNPAGFSCPTRKRIPGG
jgi:hypothetical protein